MWMRRTHLPGASAGTRCSSCSTSARLGGQLWTSPLPPFLAISTQTCAAKVTTPSSRSATVKWFWRDVPICRHRGTTAALRQTVPVSESTWAMFLRAWGRPRRRLSWWCMCPKITSGTVTPRCRAPSKARLRSGSPLSPATQPDTRYEFVGTIANALQMMSEEVSGLTLHLAPIVARPVHCEKYCQNTTKL